MKKPDNKADLRKRAENKIRSSSYEHSGSSETDNVKVLHELEVHQVELEMQNEELRKAFEYQSVLSKKYSDLFEYAPVGYLVLNSHGQILEMNLTASHITGYPRDHLTKHNFATLLPNENKIIFLKFLTAIFLEKGIQLCEVMLNSPDRQVHLYMEGRLQESGDSCMITIVDISSMKDIEKHLKKSNDDLSESVSIKDKLLSVIGHDLKGPLTGILMFFNMFSDELKDANIGKYDNHIKEIIHDTEQALTLLENLLTWAKLKTGVSGLNPEKINLKFFAGKICESLSSKSEHKNVEIVNEIPEGTFVKADRNVMMIVLSNILTNAIKFSFSKGRIELDARPLNQNVEVIVRDFGTGMSPEVLRNLFTAGQNYHTYGTANEPGSGFGLIMCRELITLQNGECWVESRKDKGTSVHFTVKK